jgi:DNA polymerase-3 subunit delta
VHGGRPGGCTLSVRGNGTGGVAADAKAAPVYLVFGSKVLADELIESLRRSHVSPEWEAVNVSALDGDECSPREVVALARTAPIGAGKRLVVVSGVHWFKKGSKVDAVLEAYAERPSPSSIVVFYQEEAPARSPFVDAVARAGGLADCSSRKGAAARLARSAAAAAGKSITPEALERVCTASSGDADFVRTEMDKLIACAGDSPVIDVTHVDLVGFGHPQSSVFELAEAVASGDAGRSLRIASGLLRADEDPQRIMQALAWQFRVIYRLKYLASRGANEEEAARTAGLMPFVASRLARWARKMPEDRIASVLEAILETDVALKSGSAGARLALETLVVRTCRILSPNSGRHQ